MSSVSPRTARIATLAVIGLFAVVGLAGWSALAKFNAIDACLDGGGAWHEASGQCANTLSEWNELEQAAE
ncbi:MAG: hypothetical protein AAFT19_07660 [Pseudomonadota bacterium]